MSDPWTAAWEEAEASAPPGIKVYDTLELIHPAFIDESGPFSVRAVTRVKDDMNFTLEAGAPLNPGQSVVFRAINFFSERPEFAEGVTPQCEVIVDNVGRELMPYLETMVGTRANLTAIYRQYRSDDLTEPCYGPVEFQIKKVTVSMTRVQGTAMLDNLSNTKFPKKLFTLNEYPGLMNG